MRKKKQYIKIILGIIILIASLGVVASFVLAFIGMDTNAEVTIALITSVIAATVAYCIKELGEKKSRNEHGLDESGQPYKTMEQRIKEYEDKHDMTGGG